MTSLQELTEENTKLKALVAALSCQSLGTIKLANWVRKATLKIERKGSSISIRSLDIKITINEDTKTLDVNGDVCRPFDNVSFYPENNAWVFHSDGRTLVALFLTKYQNYVEFRSDVRDTRCYECECESTETEAIYRGPPFLFDQIKLELSDALAHLCQ